MDLDLSTYFSAAMSLYKSPSQIARSVTETWAKDNMYCPRCGLPLHQYKNNTKVYDFYCDHSDQRFLVLTTPTLDNFQLKSMKSFPFNDFPSIITGAEYHTTLKSLREGKFPSLILLHYSREQKVVQDGMLIHRLSVTEKSISQRAPLKDSARRAKWVGTNILMDKIPEIGRIGLIRDSDIVPKETVLKKWLSVENILRGNLERRGWITDIMLLVDRLPEIFTLKEAYSYESYLGRQYPHNKHIKDKIRQQLQILRDKGYLRFVSKGKYLKLRY